MRVKTDPASAQKDWEQGEKFPRDSGSLPHSLPVEQTASESRGNVTHPAEKDEGDALSEV